MSKIRQQRTADQIQRIISELFLRELSDPRLQNVTVTDVTIDRELEHASIYVVAMGDSDELRQAEVLMALEKASGFIRRELAQRIRLRSMPQLHFHWDPTLARADEVSAILDNLDIPPAADEEE